jgi:hypothetical protein
MKLKIKRGTTSKILRVFVQDVTAAAAGLTGLAYNSASLVAYYIREGDSSATAITLVSATVGTWVSGGFKEISSTNMPGWYELHLPNAALSGGASVSLMLKGATNMAQLPIEIELDAVDYQDAAGFGLSRLDAAVSTRMASYTQPTGFLAATFPATVSSYAGGAVASVSAGVTLDAAQRVKLDASQPDYAPAKAGAAMALTPAERIATAVAIELELVNDTTNGDFMQTIADKLAAEFDIEEVGLVAIRDAMLNRVLPGNHDTANTVGAFLQRLDAAVSTRMATFVYVAPDNAGIANAASSAAGAATLAEYARASAANGSGLTEEVLVIVSDANHGNAAIKTAIGVLATEANATANKLAVLNAVGAIEGGGGAPLNVVIKGGGTVIR